MVEHVALLVPDAALDGYRAEHLVDRLPQRLRAVDDAEHALAEIERAGDQIREQLTSDGQLWRLNELGLLQEALEEDGRCGYVSAMSAQLVLTAAALRGDWEGPALRNGLPA